MNRVYILLGVIVLLILSPACQKELGLPNSHAGIHFFYQSGTEVINQALTLKSGETAYVGSAEGKALIFVVDNNGNERFRKLLAGGKFDGFNSVIELKDGNLLLSGATVSEGLGVIGGNPSGLAVKISPYGELIWMKAFIGSASKIFRVAREEASGNLIFLGDGVNNNFGFAVKTDADGNLLKTRPITVNSTARIFCNEILVSNNGDYIIGGAALNIGQSGLGTFTNYMLCVDSSLTKFRWTHLYSDFVNTEAINSWDMRIYQINTGFIMASTYEKTPDSNVFQLIFTGPTGAFLSEKEYNFYEGNDLMSNFSLMSDGSWIYCGLTANSANSESFACVVKMNNNWETEWISKIGGPQKTNIAHSAAYSPNSIIVSAAALDPQLSLQKMYWYQLSNDGKIRY